MINLTQGQKLKDAPEMRVAVPTGDYNETDLIECYRQDGDPNKPTHMFQAQYISFGNPVYQQSDELTEDQVVALKSGKSPDEVINNRKMIDGKNPAAKYLGQVVKRDGKFAKRQLREEMSQQNVLQTDTTVVDNTKKKKKDVVVEEIISDNSNTNTGNTDNTASAGNIIGGGGTTSTSAATSTNSGSGNSNATSTDPTIATSTPNIIGTSTDNGLNLDLSTSTPDINLDTSTTTSGSTDPIIDSSASSTVIDALLDTAIDPVGTATTTMKKAVGKLLASSRSKKGRRL